MAEKVEVKRKKYTVETYSHVTAVMTVFANSKGEAAEIANKDMMESLKNQLENAKPNEFISDLDGWAGATKSSVKLCK